MVPATPANAIAHGPLLLLLDEAQRGLDRLNRACLERLIGAEIALGATVLAVTHDTDFARKIAGSLLLVSQAGVELKAGRTALPPQGGPLNGEPPTGA